MVLHIHKDLTDNSDYKKTLNEFTSAKGDRRQQFGQFDQLTCKCNFHVP